MSVDYDVIVVGAGHSGSEASAMASRLGAKVLLVTSNLDTIGQMSCNPAIGGIAKGPLVREIHAPGGVMGGGAHRRAIPFRMSQSPQGPPPPAPPGPRQRHLFPRGARGLPA